MGELLLLNALLADGARLDVLISDGRISALRPAAEDARSEARAVDLEGRLLLPALGEPHAHLDKAYTADVFPNPSGDLMGAIDAIQTGWTTVTVADIAERAGRAARQLVASGTTAIRTHADVTPEGVTTSMEALTQVKRRLAGVCDMQIVALGFPVTGPDQAAGREALERAIAVGADLVGGAPHLEEDPAAAIEFSLQVAQRYGLGVDLHLDEVLDADVQHLPELARRTEAWNMGGRVTASHCVSHGLLSAVRQREVGGMLADAGVSLVTLPRTNLFLQARGIEQATPRGLAGVRALLEVGVRLAAGADNVQDPFYFVGRSDPLETASFLVAAAHLTVEEAWELVSSGVRDVMGLEEVRLERGAPAELLAVRAGSVREAMADQPADRIVIHAGRVVARTSTQTWMAGE